MICIPANSLRDSHILSGLDTCLAFYWSGLIDDVGINAAMGNGVGDAGWTAA